MTNKQNKGLLLIVCLVCGLSLISCRMFTNLWKKTKEKVNVLPALPESPSLSHIQFDDIPIPKGFKHLPKESMVYIHGNLRTAHIKYLGSKRVEDLVNFYLGQMPHQQWVFKTSVELDQKKKLLFEKDTERCEVIIENQGTKSHLGIMINHK